MPFQKKEFNEPTMAIQARIPESLYDAIMDLSERFDLRKSRFAYIIFIFGWAAFNESIDSNKIIEDIEKLENNLKPEYKKELLKAVSMLEQIDMNKIRDQYHLERYENKEMILSQELINH